ncbi:hypothetical protein B7494_g3738 [Chlorociboria aeruginascens]|nr:hypothetical protein B7494_g3738 [Chlorociboria aeruginascens]
MALDKSPDSSIDRKNLNMNADLSAEEKATNFGSSHHDSKTTAARIAPVLPHLRGYDFGDDSESDILGKQIELEAGNEIQYRTCSWQKTAALLFSEYICLAIMSFPYSYATLGLVPGLILTVVVAGLVLYTSLVVCQCTVVFAVVATVICWVASLPRTFSALSKLGTASAFFTFVSVLLATIFTAIEPHPAGYNPDPNFVDPVTGIHGGNPIVTAIPVGGVTFVAGFNAFLNISYTFIGQITLPSFIAEMKNPRDFPKALWAVTIAEVILFGLVGSIIYAYTGNQYYTAPAFGSISNQVFKKVSFSFMIPTLIFLGVLYASVSARFIFFRVFEGTKHKSSHTVVGWASWAGILLATWILAFIIAEVIPFFSDLLSLMSSLFDSFFGFIFWGVAYIRMRRVDGGVNWLREQSLYGYIMLVFNILIILIGLFFLGAGTYTSVQAIIDSYAAGAVGGVFTCVSNAL